MKRLLGIWFNDISLFYWISYYNFIANKYKLDKIDLSYVPSSLRYKLTRRS